jgi:hypothetical protein
VARPSASSFPSCSSRTLAVLSDRPVRSTTGRTVAKPAAGVRRKTTVSERGGRLSSSTASSTPRIINAIT